MFRAHSLRHCEYASQPLLPLSLFFFFNDTATTEIYTLSLHDALPIYGGGRRRGDARERGRIPVTGEAEIVLHQHGSPRDRKSTRLNSSHSQISYAVFCLKKKKFTSSGYIMRCHV